MNVYRRAVLHGWRMLAALILSITIVLAVDQFYGHSTLAFAAAIIGLVIVNAPMLRFNCPTCGKNLFFRGVFVVPWPNKTCGKCGTHLDQDGPDQLHQNR
ncbi:hypothetical protein [uncultured Erythrobacter sp.]|uniref:hypothetical protein n=1 Tax=uncultured Erythrobacter sp. TaxID=263913 RepID=UPI002637482D|nr:hypothetical protein [uncultured Erythrobacter sp.]